MKAALIWNWRAKPLGQRIRRKYLVKTEVEEELEKSAMGGAGQGFS